MQRSSSLESVLATYTMSPEVNFLEVSDHAHMDYTQYQEYINHWVLAFIYSLIQQTYIEWLLYGWYSAHKDNWQGSWQVGAVQW